MPKTLIKFGNFAKRNASKNAKSITGVNECNSIEKNYRSITSKIANSNDINGIMNTIKYSTNKILESLADSNTANKYKFYPLSILEKVKELDSSFASSIVERYCNTILPYISDIDAIIESIDDYSIGDEFKNRILKEAYIYNSCDRIVANHDTISKRFNIEDVIVKNKYNLKPAIESACSMIDTYNRDSYQKMNICLEEVFYVLEKNAIKYNKSDIVDSIVEYFLLSSPTLSEKNYNGYKKCINESVFLNEEEAANVKFIYGNRDSVDNSNIKAYINSYYTAPEKTLEGFVSTVNDCISSDVLDLTYNFCSIMNFILAIYKSDNLISDTDLEIAMESIEARISSRIVDVINNAEISRDAMDNILNCIIESLEEAKATSNTYPRVYEFIAHFKKVLNNVAYYYNFLYDNDNIEVIKTLNNCTSEVPVTEGQLFKAHNLLSAIRNLDKYLGDKCKAAVNKLVGTKQDKPSVRDKIKKVLFGGDEKSAFEKALAKGISNEKKVLNTVTTAVTGILSKGKVSESCYGYISEETHMFDMILANISIENDDISEIHDQLSSICKEFNYILESNYSLNNCRLYYIINPGEASLHLSEKTRYILDDKTITLIRESENKNFEHSIDLLSEAKAYAELQDTIVNKDLESSVFNLLGSEKNVPIEAFETILECLSFLSYDKSIINKLANRYNDSRYYIVTEDVLYETMTRQVDSLVTDYKPLDNVSPEYQLEAALMLDSILEEYTDDDFEDDNEDEDKSSESKEDNTKEKDKTDISSEELDREEARKNPYKGINLKSIKLCLLGLKAKFQKMSQKEKEISKNIDITFKHFVESIKNAMISDSRESIIKGSVIPSFSKCIKLGSVAAIGLKFGLINPGVAAMVAIGSFALSKHLTKKERVLLIDEIETELEVVDKEIQLAERDDDTTKYRELLKYKKNLQRQYQRIKYNIKVGRNILPGSNAGTSGDRQNGY